MNVEMLFHILPRGVSIGTLLLVLFQSNAFSHFLQQTLVPGCSEINHTWSPWEVALILHTSATSTDCWCPINLTEHLRGSCHTCTPGPLCFFAYFWKLKLGHIFRQQTVSRWRQVEEVSEIGAFSELQESWLSLLSLTPVGILHMLLQCNVPIWSNLSPVSPI